MPYLRQPRHARGIAIVALALAAIGCDSMPDSFGPTSDDLRASISIDNRITQPVTQVIVHPYYDDGGCRQAVDTTLRGRVVDVNIARYEDFSLGVAPGCWLVLMRFQGVPGQVIAGASLLEGASKSIPIFEAPAAPASGVADGTLRINNTAPGHTAAITRIYTDACRPGALYASGSTGGATTERTVNVAHGASTTLSLPSTCHAITIRFSDGRYDVGVVTIPTTTRSLTVLTTPQ
jgi:hypothetical protein